MRSSDVRSFKPWWRAVAAIIWSAGSLGKPSPRRTLSAAISGVNGNIFRSGWEAIPSSQLSKRNCAKACWLTPLLQIIENVRLHSTELLGIESPPNQDVRVEQEGNHSESLSQLSSEK